MNFFAHGVRFIDRPYYLAGTATPDWLSVADRRVRMRADRVRTYLSGRKAGSHEAEFAAGVLQHLDDDEWFHRSAAFYEVTGALTREFQNVLDPAAGFRTTFLGHIGMELILDGVLIARDPSRLDAYYNSMLRIEPLRIEHTVNAIARHSTDRLATLIPRFCTERFLEDYLQPDRLVFRLNQVMRRIQLPRLPDTTVEAVEAGWKIVSARVDDLLPAERWSEL